MRKSNFTIGYDTDCLVPRTLLSNIKAVVGFLEMSAL